MSLFLCHTPLHLLISLLVVQGIPAHEKITFAIIEDSQGLHALAKTLVASTNIDLFLLPGAASFQSLIKRTLIHRANARHLHDAYAKTASTIFIFHDLRAESQKLLNSPSTHQANTQFILLEDGVALYEPGGFLVDGLISILKRKIFWDMKWKHARQLGLHPQLSEVQCFYPESLRQNLHHLHIKSLPRHLADSITLHSPLKASLPNAPFCIVAVPHSMFGETFITEFLDLSRKYCLDHGQTPIFKIHPRDRQAQPTIERVISSPHLLPQEFPLELLMAFIPKAAALIGSRTSALHVINALYPETTCLYFDTPNTEAGSQWINFFEKIGVQALKDHEKKGVNIN